MARNTTLLNARNMLKGELSLNQTVGTQQDLELNTLISNTQAWLSVEYDWPFLETKLDVSVATVADRYKNLPALDFERPVKTEVWWTNAWQPVVYGISGSELTYLNSDATPPQVLNPVLRWRFYSETQFEIWPLPTAAQTIRFTGQRVLTTLQNNDGTYNDTATLDLDDLLVVLFAAADKAQDMGKPNAQTKLVKAQNRLSRIRSAYPDREQTTLLAGPDQDVRKQRTVGIKVVTVGG